MDLSSPRHSFLLVYGKMKIYKSETTAHSVQYLQLSPRHSTCWIILHMADRNTLIVDRSPLHAADPTNFESRSPPMQKSHDIQEIYEEETHRIYHFQNCGAVYINSCNAHGVRMENCSNNVPQVTTCSLFLSFLFPFSSANLAVSYYSDHSPRITNNEKDLQTLYHALSNGMWALAILY